MNPFQKIQNKLPEKPMGDKNEVNNRETEYLVQGQNQNDANAENFVTNVRGG